MALIILIIFYVSRKLSTFKPTKLELFLEIIISGLNNLVESIMGAKNAGKYFIFLLTFFVFILISNWFPLLPGVSSLGIIHEGYEYETTAEEEHGSDRIDAFSCLPRGSCYLSSDGVSSGEFIHMFRAPTADLSAGFALALISVVVTNIIGFQRHKLNYLGKYLSFKSPIDFFVGILEFISELGKLISFSFRLFGNIFAGEVLLVVITAITYGLVTLPFLGLEFFVGIIQAVVFFMLTAVFINLAIEHHHN